MFVGRGGSFLSVVLVRRARWRDWNVNRYHFVHLLHRSVLGVLSGFQLGFFPVPRLHVLRRGDLRVLDPRLRRIQPKATKGVFRQRGRCQMLTIVDRVLATDFYGKRSIGRITTLFFLFGKGRVLRRARHRDLSGAPQPHSRNRDTVHVSRLTSRVHLVSGVVVFIPCFLGVVGAGQRLPRNLRLLSHFLSLWRRFGRAGEVKLSRRNFCRRTRSRFRSSSSKYYTS